MELDVVFEPMDMLISAPQGELQCHDQSSLHPYPWGGYLCTRIKGHRGLHAGHGFDSDEPLATWE